MTHGEGGQVTSLVETLRTEDEASSVRAVRSFADRDRGAIAAELRSSYRNDRETLARELAPLSSDETILLYDVLLEVADDDFERRATLTAASRCNHPDVLDVFVTVYESADRPKLRRDAVDELRGLFTPALVSALRTAALPPEDRGWLATKRARRHLAKTVTKRKGIERRAAALGLGALGTDRAIRTLERNRSALGGDAIDGLVLAGSSGVEPLAEALEGCQRSTERTRTVAAALRRASARDDDSVPPPVVRSLLALARAAEDGTVRSDLAHTIHDTAGFVVFETLTRDEFETLASLGSVPDPDARESIARLLGVTFRQRAVPTLLELLSDDEPLVRAEAIRAISTMGMDPDSFVEGLSDGTARFEPASVHGATVPPEAVRPTVEALDDPEPTVRKAAARGLGDLGAVEETPTLCRVLESDPDTDTRRAAAGALGKLGHESAIEPLRTALEDDERVAARAAASLCNPAFDQGDYLGSRLHAGDLPKRVRGELVTCFEHLPVGDVFEPLIRTVESDPHDGVRASAASTLASLGDRRALPTLEAARADVEGHPADRLEEAIDRLRGTSIR